MSAPVIQKIYQELKNQSQRNDQLESTIENLRTQLNLRQGEIVDLKDQHEREMRKVKDRLDILEKQMVINTEQENRIKLLEEKISILSRYQQYFFSSTQKHQTITIEDNNTKASFQDSRSGLIDGAVFEKGSSIKFRILSLKPSGDPKNLGGVLKNLGGVLKILPGAVSFGLGIRNVIAANTQFPIGHGCFLLSSTGFSINEQKRLKTDFSCKKQDVVEVRTNGDELCFTNHTQKKELKMKIKLSEDEWQEACFFVHGMYCSVEIIK